MNDAYREKTAKLLLSAFRNIWCDRESDEEPFFNCSKCEFQTSDGKCGVKVFIRSKKYEMEYPQGVIEVGEQNDD